MNILLTGGAGYIGSHTAVVLSQAGYEIVLLDNFCNSKPSVLGRLEKILGKELPCIRADVRDTDIVTTTLQEYKIDAVIHFAGVKAVAESIENPIMYYSNNVQGSISILKAMERTGIKIFVFSSSATVYGNPKYLPYDEDHPTRPVNPYGRSKLQVEEILQDLVISNPEWKIACLRYFNPVGAHESGYIGEDPNGLPNNLIPGIVKVIYDELPHLYIFGNDYETKDGTGERDYIHVMDLADGHMATLNYLFNNSGYYKINLGTGKAVSVNQIVDTFEKFINKKIKKKPIGKRPGDLAIYYAKAELARNLLEWIPKRSLDEIVSSTIKWESYRHNQSNKEDHKY